VRRCPMAPQGIHGVLFDLCPGFEPVSVVIQDGPGRSIPPGRSCLHVCQGRTRRGFAAVCSHAEAERIVVAAAAARSAALAAERPAPSSPPASDG
jgi:hypothetical protein